MSFPIALLPGPALAAAPDSSSSSENSAEGFALALTRVEDDCRQPSGGDDSSEPSEGEGYEALPVALVADDWMAAPVSGVLSVPADSDAADPAEELTALRQAQGPSGEEGVTALRQAQGPSGEEGAALRQAQGPTHAEVVQGPSDGEATALRQAQGPSHAEPAQGPSGEAGVTGLRQTQGPGGAEQAPGAVPVQAPMTPAEPAAAAPAAPLSPPRAGLLSQVSAPVVALARSAEGQHSVTLTVSPENLGPVTVRAQISGGSIRLELHAPSDAGREALRVLLADLRRDLSVVAPGASVNVSTQDAPDSFSPDPQAGRSDSQSRPDSQARHDSPSRSDARTPRSTQPPLSADPTRAAAPPIQFPSPHSRIDVYA